jgi:hypothetical protein
LEEVNKAIKFLFIENSIVAMPIFSIFLIILFKATSYGGTMLNSDAKKTISNIGLELATAGAFVLLTNVSTEQSGENNIYVNAVKIMLYLAFVLVFSLSIKFFAWDKKKKSMKNTCCETKNTI